MGFDDLAKRMGGKGGAQSADADAIIAEAKQTERRMDRRKDLILGSILLAGGVIVSVLVYVMMTKERSGDEARTMQDNLSTALWMGGLGAMGILYGLVRIVRGVRGRAGQDWL